MLQVISNQLIYGKNKMLQQKIYQDTVKAGVKHNNNIEPDAI